MTYSISSTVFLLALISASYLAGMGVLARLGALKNDTDTPLLQLLAIATGIGCITVSLFILAALGFLRPVYIMVVLSLEMALCLVWVKRHGDGFKPLIGNAWKESIGFIRAKPLSAVAIALLGIAIFLLCMRTPLEWDELAYHLPLARDYATHGALVVNDHLRYPLHSNNYQLLYASALLFSSEAATHLLHAFSGVLVAAGIFIFTRKNFGAAPATLAGLMFLALSWSLLDTAYVDLGLAMFVFFSFVALALWQTKRNDAYLFISAFLLAMAAGTKYQGLVQLPIFALALLLAGRGSIKPVIRAAAVILAFGSYWYIRNWLLSGDPVHPLGGAVFGYTFWNAADMADQFNDFDRYQQHIPFMLIPSLAFIFLPWRRDPVKISLLVVGLGGLLAWYLSSRYDRYLLPSAPFLAIMSAHVLVTGWTRWTPASLREKFNPARTDRGLRILGITALVLLVAALGKTVSRKWDETCFTYSCVDGVYQSHLLSAPAIRSLENFHELKLYQFGLENELYFIGAGAAGDWFGPYRYSEVWELRNDTPALKDHLLQLGRDSILVNRSRPYFNELPSSSALQPEFKLLYEDSHVSLYRMVTD